MASLKELRTRIKSVKSTRQVTSAMKMVSAAKLRKAQDAVSRLLPYAGKLKEVLVNVSSSAEIAETNPYVKSREPKKILLIAVAGSKGLCGAFNANIAKQTIHLLEDKYRKCYENNALEVWTIGSKVEEILTARGYTVNNNFNAVFDNLTFTEVAPIAEKLMELYANATFDVIEIVYNHFVNAASQRIQVEQFLPVQLPEENTGGNSDYIFEPSMLHIAETLIPKSLKTQLFKALLDSNAAEHGARMTAMHQATDNATEMIRDLNLSYNKVRQASITNEILEIVSGADALDG